MAVVVPGNSGWRRRVATAIVATALLLLTLWWGGVLIGVVGGFGLGTPAGTVKLDRPIPSITRSDTLAVEGTTRPGAAVTAIVDGSEVQTLVTGSDGRYIIGLPVVEIGRHRIRMEVRYRGAQVDELLETEVRHVQDEVRPPRLLGVEPWPELSGFYLMVRSEPGTIVTAIGWNIEALGPERVGPSGRSDYLVTRPDRSNQSIQLIATDQDGVASAPTLAIDLAEVAGTPIDVADPERVDATIVFHIQQGGVTREQTVMLDRDRPELAQLTTGSVAAQAFIEDVAGPAGLAPADVPGCVVSNVQEARAEIEIAEQATVKVIDDFPGLLSQWNGFTDTPEVSLCFRFGMPSRRDTGAVEVRLRDFVFASVSHVPDGAAIERLESGAVERIYRWNRVPFAGRIDLALASESPSLFRLFPRATSEPIKETDDGLLPYLADLVWAFLQASGLVLLLAVVTSPLGTGLRRTLPALRYLLVLGLAIAIAPTFGGLNALAQRFETVAEVVEFAQQAGAEVVFVARAAVAAVVGMAAVASLVIFKRANWPLGTSLGVAVLAAAMGWFVLASVVTVVVDNLPIDISPQLVRMWAWVIGLVAVGTVLTAIGWGFHRLVETRRLGLGALAIVPWALLGGAVLALPAGVEGRIVGSGQAASFIELVIERLVVLAAYATPLLAFGALVAAIRAAWRFDAWYSVHTADPPGRWRRAPFATVSSHLLPALAAVTFAAFGLTATGSQQTLSFLAGLVAFALMLRPQRVIDQSAHTGLLGQSRAADRLATALGRPLGSSASPEPVSPAESNWWADRAASSVWSSVRFALTWTIPLLAPLVLLYLSQFQLTAVNREDPLYAQRAVLNLASFVTPWLFLALTFGLAYDYLRGASGLQKGLLVGGVTLLITIPIQLANGIASSLSPLEVTIWILEVVTFTVVLGLLFDIRELDRQGRFHIGRPGELVKELGVASGLPQVVTGISILVGAAATAVLTILSGQVSQVVTRVLAPFLPLPAD